MARNKLRPPRTIIRSIDRFATRNDPARHAQVVEFLYDDALTGNRVVITRWDDTGMTHFQCMTGDAQRDTWKLFAELQYVTQSLTSDPLFNIREMADRWAKEHFK